MSNAELRQLVSEAIIRRIQPQRRVELPALCDELGLPSAADDPDLTKREYLQRRLAKLPAAPTTVAECFTSMFPVSTGEEASFAIEEMLWAPRSDTEILEKHRRLLADALDAVPLWLNGEKFMEALERLWLLADPLHSLLGGTSLRDEIERHVVRNPDDWPVDHFFERLGAYDCSSRRFALLIEVLAGHRVRPDEAEQHRFAQVVNETLGPIGLDLRETNTAGGYPVFTVVPSRRGTQGRPKNLIFASRVKPDLRFRDAVNNDVEVVTHADKVLIFDRPIPADGLRWQHLQDWWAESQGLEAEAAKKSLYQRLRSCLPTDSPPQCFLFEAYHRAFGAAIPSLPALLPEVWLHYDPITVRQRGRDALFRQRMDFLMLLSSHARVVIEVDGILHYADADGHADARKYADTMRADRELQLSGYEVYRFGARELADREDAGVGSFFRRLFERHGVEIGHASEPLGEG